MKIINVFYSRYLISAIIILFINLTFNSCYSIRETTIDNDNSYEIFKVETFSGDTIDFAKSKSGSATIIGDKLVWINKNGDQETYPKSNIKTYFTEKFDFGKTVWTVIGVTAAVSVILIGLFVLSMDGRGFSG